MTFLVQHDLYHRYTVDEHTLTAIDALDRGGERRAPTRAPGRLRQVLDEVAQPAALYLGLLLHDIGKGRGGGHVAQGSAHRRARLRAAGPGGGHRRADVAFLVEAHLEMSQISQRRDLSEPGLVEAFARARRPLSTA